MSYIRNHTHFKPTLAPELFSFFSVVCLILLLSIQAKPSSLCSSFYVSSIFLNLPSSLELGLPEEVKLAIKNHKLSHFDSSSKTSKLKFAIDPQPDFSNSGYIGESIQATFVKKILIEIFPKAQFVKQSEADNQAIKINIRDVAEKRITQNDPIQKFLIDMPLLKFANGSVPAISKTQLRSELGISELARVVTVYGGDIVNQADFFSRLLTKYNGPSVVFFSDREVDDFHFHKLNDKLKSVFGSSFRLLKLSEVRPGALGGDLPVFVFNDTLMRQPNLYLISDLAIIDGPINFAEALNAHVTTYVIDDQDPHRRHYRDTMLNLWSIGSLTGNLHVVSSPSALYDSLPQIQVKPKSYLKTNQVFWERGKTAIDVLLDRLGEVIEEQLFKSQ